MKSDPSSQTRSNLFCGLGYAQRLAQPVDGLLARRLPDLGDLGIDRKVVGPCSEERIALAPLDGFQMCSQKRCHLISRRPAAKRVLLCLVHLLGGDPADLRIQIFHRSEVMKKESVRDARLANDLRG